jgi:hypothetical protein
MVYAYGATLVEVVRRREFGEFFFSALFCSVFRSVNLES